MEDMERYVEQIVKNQILKESPYKEGMFDIQVIPFLEDENIFAFKYISIYESSSSNVKPSYIRVDFENEIFSFLPEREEKLIKKVIEHEKKIWKKEVDHLLNVEYEQRLTIAKIKKEYG